MLENLSHIEKEIRRTEKNARLHSAKTKATVEYDLARLRAEGASVALHMTLLRVDGFK